MKVRIFKRSGEWWAGAPVVGVFHQCRDFPEAVETALTIWEQLNCQIAS